MIHKIINNLNNLFNSNYKINTYNNNETKENIYEILEGGDFYKYFRENIRKIIFTKGKIRQILSETENKIIELSIQKDKESVFNSKRILLNKEINKFNTLSNSYITFIEDEINIINEKLKYLKEENKNKDFKQIEEKISLIKSSLLFKKRLLNKKETDFKNFIKKL